MPFGLAGPSYFAGRFSSHPKQAHWLSPIRRTRGRRSRVRRPNSCFTRQRLREKVTFSEAHRYSCQVGTTALAARVGAPFEARGRTSAGPPGCDRFHSGRGTSRTRIFVLLWALPQRQSNTARTGVLCGSCRMAVATCVNSRHPIAALRRRSSASLPHSRCAASARRS
jgi:hypothetical protein